MPSDPRPTIVLDTNVLLDWLVFANPALAPLETALMAKEVRWIATAAMHDEMAHVLRRGLPGQWTVDESRWQAAWVEHAELLPAPTAPLAVPRCSDGDDQKFLDLAIVAGARWLLSRDRAVLKLARRMKRYDVEVLTPERWRSAPATPAPVR